MDTATRAPYTGPTVTHRIVYETQDCRRCGGDGRLWQYRYQGGRCFDCHGYGKQRTRAAQRAAERLEETLPSIATVDLIPGDRIYRNTDGWATVKGVEIEEGYWGSRRGDDWREGTHQVNVDAEAHRRGVWGGGRFSHGHDPDRPFMVRRAMTEEEYRVRLELAESLPGVRVEPVE